MIKEALRCFSRVKISGNGKRYSLRGKKLFGNYSQKK